MVGETLPTSLEQPSPTEEKHVMKNDTRQHTFTTSVTFAALIVAVWSLVLAPAEAGQFGTRGQRDFEGGGLTTLDYAYDRCDMFEDELDDSDTSLFNYTLKWGESGFS